VVKLFMSKGKIGGLLPLCLAVMAGAFSMAKAQSIVPPHVMPPIQQPGAPGVVPFAVGNGIAYNGGPVILGTTNVYYIWYGNWSGDTSTTILPDLAAHIGGSAYFNINTNYFENTRAPLFVSNSVHYGGSTTDNYSQGTSLSDYAIQLIVAKATSFLNPHPLPLDSNGVYVVLTSSDVQQSGSSGSFCNQYCGWHTYAPPGAISRGAGDIKYAFVGNASLQCPAKCMGQTLSSPNGNVGADGMANVIAHEVEEAVTDPDLSAWYNVSNGVLVENADICRWLFGTEYYVANGSKANMKLGSRDYLIQENWVPNLGGYCALAF